VPYQALPGTITLPLSTCGQLVTMSQKSDTKGHKSEYLRAVGVGLAALARIARDHRTYERLLLAAIVLAAAVGATHAGATRSVTRLVAWDKQRDLPKKLRGKAMRSEKSLASP
jgi:hypothetical protein